MRYSAAIVARVLAELDLQVQRQSKGWGLLLCPLHDNRATPALTVHLEEGMWRCYAGCGQGGDIAHLLALVRGQDPADVRRELLHGMAADPLALERLLAESEEGVPEARWQEALFYERGRTSQYMLRRGFTLATLARWEVGWDPETQSDVVPVRAGGVLVGLIRRPHSGQPAKYMTSVGLDKSRCLVGLDLVPADVRTVTVVEGPLDAIWLDQHGIAAVALMGAVVSDAQADTLTRRFTHLVTALDADRAGREGTRQFHQHRWLQRLVLASIELPLGRKDVGECTADELHAAFAPVRHWGVYSLAGGGYHGGSPEQDERKTSDS